MYTDITVIPVDNFISVDGKALFFTFLAPQEMHALQWHNGSGHIEYSDGRSNAVLTADEYATAVTPYVQAWEEEKARLEEEANRLPTPEELVAVRKAEILAQLMEIDADSIRPLRAIADGTATDFDREKLAALDSEAADLREELAGLGQTG
jgi:hypothetical protein